MFKKQHLDRYTDLSELSKEILSIMASNLNLESFFISEYNVEYKHFDILNSLHFDGNEIPEETKLACDNSYCGKLVDEGKECLIVENSNENQIFKELPITRTLNIASYIGVTIILNNGEVYGTLCGYNSKPRKYTEEEIALFKKIASLTAYIIEVQRINFTDSLTKLYNRSYLELLSLNTELNNEKTGYVILDVDNFSSANTMLGQNKANLLLLKIAERLKGNISSSDIAIRINGDEFLVLLKDIQEEELNRKSNEIFKHLKEPFQIKEDEYYITVSMTSAMHSNLVNATTECDVINNLQRFLRKIKQNGKNQYRPYHSRELTGVYKKLQIKNELHKAIEENQFTMFYQPKIDFGTDKIIGAESLIRWIHPELGFIPPNDFISIAEDSGLMSELGNWILKNVCQQTALWSQKYNSNLTISVNISIQQIQKDGFVNTVKQIIKETNVNPALLKFELTETLLMLNIDQVINKILELRKLGIKISLDDFGTGYSSLNYLKKLPVDELKLDRTFIKDLTIDNYFDTTIVTSIVELSSKLGITVVAEGIETKEHYQILKNAKCHEGQGYLFSRPIPVREFEELYDNYKKTF